MRILLLSPESERIRELQKELIGLGHRVQVVLPPPEGRVGLVQEAVDSFGPHVVHAFGTPPDLRLPDGVPLVTGMDDRNGEDLVRAWLEATGP